MKTLVHSYQDLCGGEWLRGNLHTHSHQSDGAASPQAVIDDYAGRGYGFLMFADHDIHSSTEFYRGLNDRGLVLIPGNEIGGGPHFLHVNAAHRVSPKASRQEIINEVLARPSAAAPGLAIVNHPNWEARFDHATIAQLREWSGYAGLEIYNGVISRLDGSPYATNKWDILLGEGRRLWGFANDDSHRPDDVGRGWNTAYVRERTVAGVVDALRQGRFYCSTGVVITRIAVDGARIRVETENARRICALRDTGARFAQVDDRAIEVTVPEDARYVRFECWGDGEQFAWTQPFFVEDSGETTTAPTGFIEDWQVSRLLEHGALSAASPAEADTLPFAVLRPHPTGHAAAGFLDIREKTNNRPGVIYLRTDAVAERDTRAVLQLGYDGPLRVWINGEQVFAGPGTNPARPDMVAVYAPLARGPNQVLIAFDTNGGQAWGVFGRLVV